MKHRGVIPSLACAGVIVATATAYAAPVITTSSQTTVFPVSNTDLLQQSGVTHVNRDNAGNTLTDTNALFTYNDGNNGNTASLGVPALTNGQFGLAGRPQAEAEYAGVAGQAVGTSGLPLNVTYALNIAASPAGYNLTGIDVYTGWADNGRDDINVSISYSTAAAPATFLPLTTVNFVPGVSTTPIDNKASVTDSSGLLAAGVANLRFEFPLQENSGVGYREIDVFGTAVPEPASAGLLGLGALGLLARRRRADRTR